ncbi:ribonuclease HI family protein [Levilactobacillus suantsaii]|uniref:Ribonuclease HI n=1 Tax=Levilactobacillus suantsaii TaxID=2292255 RepID=A0A4Q0VK65_9LACO|nr:ribonuclease HI family protein [Levilactobacillus suantsaii]RXI78668.1 ribonuclease HI [Levilactobacillus suantsaii]
MYSLYTDAATQPQSGLSAGGILLIHDHQQTQTSLPLQATTNHLAEFEVATLAFTRLAHTLGAQCATTTVLFYTDSLLVSQSVAKRYAKHYQSEVDALLSAQRPFQLVLTQWVPEKQNQGAHTLANQALHAREDFK